jgi:hypothetical protein
MTVFFDTLGEGHLGFSAIFACVGLGFLFFRSVVRGGVGPGYWAASFFLNSLGFLFWSGVIPLAPRLFFLIGEVFHILGFFALVWGAYRFAGYEYRKWNIYAVGAWASVWIGTLVFGRANLYIAALLLKSLRIVLFLWAGAMILRHTPEKALAGRRLAGWSLVSWGCYLVLISCLPIDSLQNLVFGFLAGFQVLAAFGMVAMMVDRMRVQAEESEIQVRRLEGLLPICAYCKRIRDESNSWHNIESYIEERSSMEFSHGICPECAQKHYGDLGK